MISRPPIGETADTAHDVLWEYEVVDALQDTDVPVPKTVVATGESDVIGVTFYVMMEDSVPQLAEHGIEIIEGERPI